MKIAEMKPRIIIKNILFTLVGAVILYSAIGKLTHRETLVSLFSPLNMADVMVRIGIVQLIIVGCLAYKPLRSLGVLIASAFLGGMIFMMVATENNPLSAVLTLLMLWVAYKLEWWGYWNHYTESQDKCGCGWCDRSKKKKHHDFITRCDCKDGVCNC